MSLPKDAEALVREEGERELGSTVTSALGGAVGVRYVQTEFGQQNGRVL